MFKFRLPPREQWVDHWIDMSVDESLEDFKGDTQQRCGMVALWVPQCIFWLRDCNCQRSSPDLWNFELAYAGSGEVAKQKFES